jgi:hypothetical protein
MDNCPEEARIQKHPVLLQRAMKTSANLPRQVLAGLKEARALVKTSLLH